MEGRSRTVQFHARLWWSVCAIFISINHSINAKITHSLKTNLCAFQSQCAAITLPRAWLYIYYNSIIWSSVDLYGLHWHFGSDTTLYVLHQIQKSITNLFVHACWRYSFKHSIFYTITACLTGLVVTAFYIEYSLPSISIETSCSTATKTSCSLDTESRLWRQILKKQSVKRGTEMSPSVKNSPGRPAPSAPLWSITPLSFRSRSRDELLILSHPFLSCSPQPQAPSFSYFISRSFPFPILHSIRS